MSLTGTYSGPMLVQHMESSGTPVDIAVETPSFFDANFKAMLPSDLINSTLDEPEELPVQTEEDVESDEYYEEEENWIF